MTKQNGLYAPDGATYVTYTDGNGNILNPAKHPGYTVNNWYVPLNYDTTANGAATTTNSIRLYPGYVAQTLTISNLGGRVITPQTSSNIQFAIYANGSGNKPTGNALVSTASMAGTVAGTISSAASVQLPTGLYWFAGNTDTAGIVLTALSSSTTGSLMNSLIGSATQGNVLGSSSGTLVGYTFAQTFGTWPNLTGQTFGESNGVAPYYGIEFQVASIP